MLSFTSLKGSPASEIRDFLDSKFADGATLKHVMVEFYWAIPELRMKNYFSLSKLVRVRAVV